MTVLVTGGAGYIGSHTVRQLRRLGRSAVVLDDLDTGHPAAVLDAPLVIGNIADADLVAKVCAEHGVTSVVHFAAHKNVGESMATPSKYWHNNVDGTVRLVDALLEAGVREFVFSSSCSVYGTPAVVPVSEAAPIHPESVYAESKATMERILAWFGVTAGLRTVNLRYFNAAGASLDNVIGEDWAYSANLIPVVMKAALGLRPPVRIFGSDYPTPDGTAIRDYIHVEDLAEAHVKALGYLVAGGETTALNLGTGVGTSVKEVLDTTEELAGVRVPRSYVGRRAGDPVELWADNAQAREVLGWEPVYRVPEIIASAWRWHSSDPDRFTR